MSGVARAQGMTGADKSVIVADLLAQIGHRFGFRLIVEEGLSHAVLTQMQDCQPVITNPKMCGYRLPKCLGSSHPRATAAGLGCNPEQPG